MHKPKMNGDVASFLQPNNQTFYFVFFQLLLTFDPILVEKVAVLLYRIMQDNPQLPRLYLSGVFFFIMMYTGSNVLPVAR